MKYTTFRIWKMGVIIIMAILVAWSVMAGNAWIPVPAFVAASVIIYLISRGTRNRPIDERTYIIADKASRLAFRIFGLFGAVIGATLLALSRDSHPELEQSGFALLYAVCALLVVYLIGYTYYSRKLGGVK